MKTKFLFIALFGINSIFSQITPVPESNTTLGDETGNPSDSNGSYSNTLIGYQSGKMINRFAQSNTFLGSSTGVNITSGQNNTCIGVASGYNLGSGSNNVFLGNSSGFNETGSNKLYIDNSNTTTPLIWGDFANDQLKFNGNVSIGTQLTPGGYKLAVGGKIIAEELKIQLQSSPWPDYVFSSDYKLPTLEEVEKQIKEKGHLANVPSASEIEKNGYEIGNMTTIQQEKIEELTLYIIEQNKINEKQNKEIDELKISLKSLLNEKQ